MALNAGFTGEIVMALGGWRAGGCVATPRSPTRPFEPPPRPYRGTNPFPLGNAVATAGGNRGVNETELPMRSSGPSI
jgi:hypothetical protein